LNERRTIVTENGGYEAFDDFRYLVHRVAYLPETRQTLIWDHKAQIRAVMLICSDVLSEKTDIVALSRDFVTSLLKSVTFMSTSAVFRSE